MTVTYERRLPLAGSLNFRDLGGYETVDGRSVRWRKLFRSDALHRLTQEDLAHLEDIGLTAVFDLRSSLELDEDGVGPLFDGNELHRHVPFHANPTQYSPDEMQMDIFALYQRMLEQAQPCLNTVFTALAEDSTYPAVFHCAAGKDRTGIIASLVLSVLGVPEDRIIEDYALTETYMAERLEALRTSPELQKRYAGMHPSWLRAKPETMVATLAEIKTRHGSVNNFLHACDITTDHMDAIHYHLLA